MNTEDITTMFRARCDHYLARIKETELVIDTATKNIVTFREFVAEYTATLEQMEMLPAATGTAESAPRSPKKKPGEIEKAIIGRLASSNCSFDNFVEFTGLNRSSLLQATKRLTKSGRISLGKDGIFTMAPGSVDQEAAE